MARLRNDPVLLLVAIAAALVAAGGWVHLREWLDIYRDVPSSTPGAFVVTVGFPAQVAVSLGAVLALLLAAVRWRRLLPVILAATLLFQIGALVSLVLTRTGSFLGWSEPIWTTGADQTRALELGAIGALLLVAAVLGLERRQSNPTLSPPPSVDAVTSR